MSITDEFTRLQELHECGTLTEDEFAAAKAKVLAAGTSASDTQELRQEIRRLKTQDEITRLDQDWEIERVDYMFHGRYGSRSVPTIKASIGGAVGFIVLGLFCLLLDKLLPTGGFWTFLGGSLIVGSLWVGVYSYNKTVAYDQAYARYQQRHGDLTAQLRA